MQDYADQSGISFYEALQQAETIPSVARALPKIKGFVEFMSMLRTKAAQYSVSDLLEEVIELTGYVKELEAEKTDEAQARIENIDELMSKTVSYQETMADKGEKATLSGFLEEIALVSDIDTVDPDQDYVLLMTLHSAKGLEFPCVFLTGMEDGLFPSYPAISSGDPSDLEEERRLCYVGITRAMKELSMSCASMRMLRGEQKICKVSRFIREVPRELVELGYENTSSARPAQTVIPEDRTYARMKQAFQTREFQPRSFKVTKADSLDYGVGDTVRHVKFGVGIVKNIAEGGRDYEVTVEFDRAGIKKMFASFAKLKKI